MGWGGKRSEIEGRQWRTVMFSKDREAGLAWEGWPGGGGWGVGEEVWYAGILGLCGLGRRVRVPPCHRSDRVKQCVWGERLAGPCF